MLVLNYLCLLIMNVCFNFAGAYRDMNHMIDALGIGSLLIVLATDGHRSTFDDSIKKAAPL